MLLLHLVTLSKIEWAEIFLGHLCQRGIFQNVLFSQQGAGMAWAEGYFYFIPHQLKNYNLLKKSLQVWVPELF